MPTFNSATTPGARGIPGAAGADAELTPRQEQQLGCVPTTVGMDTLSSTGTLNAVGLGTPGGGVGWVFDGNDDLEITGMTNAGVDVGDCIHFFNDSDKDLTFAHEDAGSAANNQFTCPEHTDLKLKPGNFVTWTFAGWSKWIACSTSESE